MRWNIIFKLTFRQLIIPLAGIACGNVYAALDPPHDTAGCLSCHNMTSTETNLLPPLGHPPTSIDETPANTTCEKCHLTGELGIPIVSTTHSSVNTGEDYGEWTVECSVCHNQHLQEQEDNGSTYGKFIRRAVNLANIKGGDGNTLGKTGIKPVKFTGPTGPNSFADGDATYNGICEVCHDQTAHYQGDGTGTDQNHAYVAKLAAKNANLNNTHQNCVACHPHQNGFRPSCPDCHGFPPTNNTPGDRNGLVGTPTPTGSTTNGQHALHATSAGYNYPCHTCHYGGMTMTMTADDPNVDKQIQVGFNIEADDFLNYPAKKVLDNIGVTYHGQVGLLNGYTYTGTGTTTADSAGTMTCNGVYCHTDGKSLLNVTDEYALAKYPPRFLDGKGNKTPPWNSNFSSFDTYNDGNRCNNCHDYPPRYDAHVFHIVRGFDCDTCHYGIVADSNSDGTFDTILDRKEHVNGAYNVESGEYFSTMSDMWKGRLGGAGISPHHTVGTEYFYNNNFTYTPATGIIGTEVHGGQCSSNVCHVGAGIDSETKRWRNLTIPTESNPSFNWTPSGNQQCSTPGVIGRTIGLTVYQNCDACVGPYYYRIDWGDGNIDDCSYNPAQDPPSPDCRVSSTGFSHVYQYDINSESYPDRAYDITWSIEDGEGIPMNAPDPRTTRVVVCPRPNTPPEFDWLWAAGPDANAYDISLSVTARDLDYATGSHSGPAIIQIIWNSAGTKSEYEVNLTGTTATFTEGINTQTAVLESFTHTYPNGYNQYVQVKIKDNAPENTSYAIGKQRPLTIGKSSVGCISNCSYTPPP